MNTDPLNASRYLRFVLSRHLIWEKRQKGEPQPWTTDLVLACHKFTNVFRILDFGSQFLFNMLDEAETAGDALSIAFLYRYTNRPEPWVRYREIVGRYPTRDDLTKGLVLKVWRELDVPVFGQAYKMFVGRENTGMDRLTWAVELARTYTGYTDEAITWDYFAADSMERRLEILQQVPRCGGFMAMQIETDMGWTRFIEGDEDEFVIAGPGARVGAKLVAPREQPVDVIRWAQKMIHEHLPAVALELPDGRLRRPSLMDCQNTFCEYGKYVRYLEKSPLDRPYRAAHPGPQPRPVLPRHW